MNYEYEYDKDKNIFAVFVDDKLIQELHYMPKLTDKEAEECAQEIYQDYLTKKGEYYETIYNNGK
jgi:hypothetical protein